MGALVRADLFKPILDGLSQGWGGQEQLSEFQAGGTGCRVQEGGITGCLEETP